MSPRVRCAVADHRDEQADPGCQPGSARPHERGHHTGDNDRERYQARVIERVLTQYEDFGAEDLDYLLDKLGDVLGTAA